MRRHPYECAHIIAFLPFFLRSRLSQAALDHIRCPLFDARHRTTPQPTETAAARTWITRELRARTTRTRRPALFDETSEGPPPCPLSQQSPDNDAQPVPKSPFLSHLDRLAPQIAHGQRRRQGRQPQGVTLRPCVAPGRSVTP